MNSPAEELKREFQQFRLETKARLDAYPMLSEETYKNMLKSVLSEINRDEEKIYLMRRIERRLAVACVTSFLIGMFILWTLYFTTPI